MKFIKKLSLLSLGIILSACKPIVVPDVRKCAVKGILIAGANCAHTGHTQIDELDFNQLQILLEEGAIITSHADALKEKNVMEQLCQIAGDRCTYEQKRYISNMVK